MVADKVPTTKPMRVGRLRLASAGSNTLPAAIAADKTIVPSSKKSTEGPVMRKPIPAIISAIDHGNTCAIPHFFAAHTASGENSANTAIGAAAIRPI